MLSELTIQNFAIIDSLLLRFYPGFTVLTGETGAGKSIIIDALQAGMGGRVGPEVVRGDARFAAVEAVFDRPDAGRNEALDALLADYGAEDDDCLILRREIHAAGRSTARINGRAAPLSALATVAAALVDIHGQSDHLSILKRDRQLDVLDRYGTLQPLRGRVAESVKEASRLRGEVQELTSGAREAAQRLDLLRFQVREIESAQLGPGEEGELELERNLLVSAERRTQLSGAACDALQGEAGAALDGLYRAVSSLRDLAALDPSLAEAAQRLEAAQYEVEDIAQELRGYRDRVEYDPNRLNSIEERVDLLTRLKRKYGSTVEEIIAFGEQARARMEDVENLDERLALLQRQVDEAERRAGGLAYELSRSRAAAAETLSEAMRDALQGLGLKSTSFQVELTRTPAGAGLPMPDSPDRYAFSQTGIDAATFLVSFNPGEPLRPLDKVASGGETSRFLLALKSVLAGADQIPTLIFDEVDVGVGGRAAVNVGERLRSLARSHQVLSITHLPQIAALADQHLAVTKSVNGGRTTVRIQPLEAADRVLEIAEMMSGTGSEAARRNAEELLEAARRAQ
ncbi:MAG: DNA repair protein RecN [Chloroflexi bacterium]|nr:DNA repair protein RecN [Chloroflexota bacterium]